MEDISLHILDIVENCIHAGARHVDITIVEDTGNDLLTVEVRDDGSGMNGEMARKSLDPFFSTKGKKTGLGIPLLQQAARESGGDLVIDSKSGQGTKVVATFRYSHVDRKPIGDISETLRCLVAANPGVNFCYEYRKGDEVRRMDTRGLRRKNHDKSYDQQSER
jgi:anti-sigma regulatory factor (Ser/Thr protein kinase)